MNDWNILVVDDDIPFRNGIEKYLRSRGCTRVRSASTGETALELVKESSPQVILLDLYLPLMNGLKALREIQKIDKNIAVFILTCEEDEEYRNIAAKFGAF